MLITDEFAAADSKLCDAVAVVVILPVVKDDALLSEDGFYVPRLHIGFLSDLTVYSKTSNVYG